MAIPAEVRETAEAALKEFTEKHSSGAVAHELRYTYALEENAALLIEQRPGFMNPSEWSSRAIAKFRYSQARDKWSLYWTDSSERWHRVSNIEAAKDIRVLLDAVVADALGVFWG